MKRAITLIIVAAMGLALCACGNIGGSLSPSQSAAETAPVTEGRLQGGDYENAFLGLAAALDGDWTLLSSQELAALSTDDTTYDMYAYADGGAATLGVTLQKLGVVYGAALTEEDCPLAVKDDVLEALSANYSNLSAVSESAELAGVQHPSLFVTGKVDAMDIFLRQFYIKKDGYLACVTCFSCGDDATEELASLFKPAEPRAGQ